jgi:zona occludens toxin (predicted ATPase)
MTINKQWTDIEIARRIGFILEGEAQRLFGRPFEGKLEDFLDRPLSAGAAVNPTAYNIAYILRCHRKRH